MSYNVTVQALIERSYEVDTDSKEEARQAAVQMICEDEGIETLQVQECFTDSEMKNE